MLIQQNMKCLYSQFCPTTFVCSNIRCPNLLICKHTRSRHNRRHKLVAIRKTVANSLEFHRVREQRDKVYDQVKHHVGILHEYNKMVHKMIQLQEKKEVPQQPRQKQHVRSPSFQSRYNLRKFSKYRQPLTKTEEKEVLIDLKGDDKPNKNPRRCFVCQRLRPRYRCIQNDCNNYFHPKCIENQVVGQEPKSAFCAQHYGERYDLPASIDEYIVLEEEEEDLERWAKKEEPERVPYFVLEFNSNDRQSPQSEDMLVIE